MPNDSKNRRAQAGRVLGIDYGSKRVGVAISDPTRLIAQPVGAMENNPGLIARICSMVQAEGVVCIVVGMPYNGKDERGKKAAEVDRFIEALQSATRVPVDIWDESFTSVEAKAIHIRAGMKRKQRRQKGRVDVMAARLLLQEYLEQDRLRGATP